MQARDTVSVRIGESTYTFKKTLSWAEAEAYSASAHLVVQVPTNRLQNLAGQDMVNALPDAVNQKIATLAAWLLEVDGKAVTTRAMITDITPSHARKLFKYIAEELEPSLYLDDSPLELI